MTENKTKRIKKETYQSEEQIEMKRFIIILIILIIIVLAVYLFTRIFVTKDLLNESENETTTPGVINYNITSIGAMLTKPEDEYYVLIYDTTSLDSVYYSSLASSYSQNEKALKVYLADLNNELNKKYYDKSNIKLNVTNIEELKVGDRTLIKVKKGAITETYQTEADIAKILAKTTENK